MTVQAWSNSRESLLAECERKFGITYYAPARRNSRDQTLRKIAYLKGVKSIAMWKGELVHSAVAEWWMRLARGTQVSSADLARNLTEKANAEWRASLQTVASLDKGSDGGTVLFEHEFSVLQDDTALSRATEEMRHMLDCFIKLTESAGIKREFLSSKRYWIEPPVFGPQATSFLSGDVNVMTKVDLALLSAAGDFLVVDWKTGRDEDDHDDQMDLYILWAHLTLRVPLNNIEARVVNLRSGTVMEHRLDEWGKRARLSRLHQAVTYLRTIVPADASWPDVLGYFNYAPNVGVCKRCQFQRLCGDLG